MKLAATAACSAFARIAIAWLLAAIAPLALATATYVVNNNGDPEGSLGDAVNCAPGNANTCTLRDAISASNAEDGDTILFASDMTIVITNNAYNPDTALSIDATGHTVIIDGNHAFLPFLLRKSSQLTHMTIQNGAYSAVDVGAVWIPKTNTGVVTLTDISLVNNAATSAGAIRNEGTLNLINCTVSHSTATFFGGGIYNMGTMTLTNTSVSNNTAGSGGGIYNNGGTLTLIGSTVSGNSAVGSGGGGGGIYSAHRNEASTQTFPILTLINTTVADNQAPNTSGGGLYLLDGVTNVTNGTFSGNTAQFFEGEIFGDFGGGQLLNSVIAADGCVTGGYSDGGGNLFGGACNVTDPTSQSNAMLNLATLSDNGGPTQTMLPGPGSAAINFTTCATAPATDQRGYPRPDPASVGSSTPCDAGALEVGAIPTDRIFSDGFGAPPSY